MSYDYDDAHLAAIYDHDNPSGDDHAFYRALVDELGARTVVDLGCGTGLLTAQLVDPGNAKSVGESGQSVLARRVVGIDPAQAMLDVARSQPHGDQVEWVCGTSAALRRLDLRADLVLMTGNVAMHILGEEWPATLRDVAQALAPGGTLAFETRNPEARAWLEWNGAETVRDTPIGPLKETWRTELPDSAGVVTMHLENLFLADGYDASFTQRLQFRSFDQVVGDLRCAGLELVACYRDWERTPFTGGKDQRLMVFVAQRPLDE